MDAGEIRKLKPKLIRYLGRVRRLLFAVGDAGAFCHLRRGAVVGLVQEELRADRRKGGRSAADLQAFLAMYKWNEDRWEPHSRDRRPPARRAQRPWHLRRNQRREARREDPRRAAGMVRHDGQEGEVHRHGASGLCHGRLPLPVGWRVVFAGELVGTTATVAARRYPRRRGLPAEMEDRPGASRPRGSNGVAFDWLTFDEGYGGKPEFLRELAGR